MRLDLARASVAYMDARKRVADFHALRHTFISNLARAGVHPRNAQALARHSTIDLTMNVYTHVEMGELASDLESLPSVFGQSITAAYREVQEDMAAAIPAELTALANGWSGLPEHVRRAIATLAQAGQAT